MFIGQRALFGVPWPPMVQERQLDMNTRSLKLKKKKIRKNSDVVFLYLEFCELKAGFLHTWAF